MSQKLNFPFVDEFKSEFEKSFVPAYKFKQLDSNIISVVDSLGREVINITFDPKLGDEQNPIFIVNYGEKYSSMAWHRILDRFESIFTGMPYTKTSLFFHILAEKLKAQRDGAKERKAELESAWFSERLRLWKLGIKVP